MLGDFTKKPGNYGHLGKNIRMQNGDKTDAFFVVVVLLLYFLNASLTQMIPFLSGTILVEGGWWSLDVGTSKGVMGPEVMRSEVM